MADRFDGDGSGSVSIKEMQAALNALSRGEALPEARKEATPQIIVDSTEDEEDWLGASRDQVTEMRRSRDMVSSPKSPLYSPEQEPHQDRRVSMRAWTTSSRSYLAE